MASAAEQLAAISISAPSPRRRAQKRIWFTLGALIVARSAPIFRSPASTPRLFAQIFQQHSGGVLGMVDMFSGGRPFSPDDRVRARHHALHLRLESSCS